MKDWCLEVWGDYACFTRPEMKVERVSYDVITPSAARAIYEAILWKPAIRWNITKIEVLNPIKWISVRRNEVGKKFSGPTADMMQNGWAGRLDFLSKRNDNNELVCSYKMYDIAYMPGLILFPRRSAKKLNHQHLSSGQMQMRNKIIVGLMKNQLNMQQCLSAVQRKANVFTVRI